ncbi:MAG: DUF2238 domain-containing protein [Bdellovibrio sp.]|jgi:putative membrane protein
MFRKIMFVLVALVFIWSGIDPYDRFTWVMEVFPVVVGAPLLIYVMRKYGVTQVLFFMLALHAMVLCLGGKYTYARVPIGFTMQEMFGFARNHYDRFGHLMQGFVPALFFREWILRKKTIPPGKLLFTTVVSFCVLFAVFYEFLEWWTALITGEGAESFLGTQGDPWDTHWDILLALVGAVLAQLTFSRLQDRQLRDLRQ